MSSEEKQPGAAAHGKPVFLVGIFRSGTSLLYALLNRHPQIGLMFESDALDFPEFFSKKRFKGNWLERQEFYNKALSRHRLIYANRLNGLENVRTPEDLYRTYGDGKKALVKGEKSPSYCLRLRQLARRCPEASFILIWRDPHETYRSIRDAGRKVRFFNHVGISRFVYYQEQMVRQVAELEIAGKRICHVSYNELMDRPRETCRTLCEFLNVEFDPAMLNLAQADFSATHSDSQKEIHGHLMRGVIERRKVSGEILSPEVVRKLQRFQARWRRMGGKHLSKVDSDIEPSLTERLYHETTGKVLIMAVVAKRVLFEFLPMTWLKTYRRTKKWFTMGKDKKDESLSFAQDFSEHRLTILVSFLILAVVGAVDLITPPQTVLIPFYLLPSAILALTVNRQWSFLGTLATAFVWTAAKIPEHPDLISHQALLCWNCASRFFALQLFVQVLNRVRFEIESTDCD